MLDRCGSILFFRRHEMLDFQIFTSYRCFYRWIYALIKFVLLFTYMDVSTFTMCNISLCLEFSAEDMSYTWKTICFYSNDFYNWNVNQNWNSKPNAISPVIAVYLSEFVASHIAIPEINCLCDLRLCEC